jgi:hypothetical protein
VPGWDLQASRTLRFLRPCEVNKEEMKRESCPLD